MSITIGKGEEKAMGPSKAPPCSDEVEDWLKARGVKFGACTEIALGKVNEKLSRSNQARADAINPETVDRYTQAYRNGDDFPPLVVYPRGDGFIIVDGNHRHAAAKKAQRQKHTAYIIDRATPTETIELLTAEANTKHGDPTPVSWRVQQAIYLMALGHDQETVAKALGISGRAIETALRVAKYDNRAKKLGIPGWDALANTVKDRLGAINLDSIFIEAVKVAAETEMNAAQAAKFVQGLRAQGSESSMLSYAGLTHEERMAEIRAKQAGAGRKRSTIANPKTNFVTAVGKILALDVRLAPRLFLSEQERAEFGARCEAAAEKLLEIEEKLRRG